jgi:beta-aspartyl-dipeptidase (metallo-type)
MDPLLTLLSGADVHAPEPIGQRDVLIGGGRIVALVDPSLERGWDLVEKVDLHGLVVTPGLVDSHVHFLGGGGGDGYDSRSPELQLSDFTKNGVTTAVGPLGIDPVSRSLEGLLAKARALTQGGITAYVYTGGFRRPLLNLTGSPWRDAYLVPEVRGVKLAIGVDRAPSHATRELADLGRELYWVERATGRTQVLHVHLGTLADGHALVRELAEELADSQRLVVTHCNRTERHVETAIALAGLGVWTDMTCMISPARGMPGSLRASDAVIRMQEAGAPLERVTLSTDGNGQAPEREPGGDWAPYRTHMDSLLDEIRALIGAGLTLGQAIAMASAKPAEALGLEEKGRIRVGADADLLAFGPGLQLREVYARGRRLFGGGRVLAPGRYERPEG